MKHNYFRYGVLALLIAVGSASCSDDDTLVKPEPSPIVDPELPGHPELTLEKESIDLLINETQTIEILDGAGDYKVSVLDDSNAEVTLSGSSIQVKGLKYGNTDLVVSDQGGAYAMLTVNVYKSNELTTSTVDGKMKLTLAMGQPANGYFSITAGNDPYTVKSSDPETVSATLGDDGITVNLVGQKGQEEGAAPVVITITDARGLTAEVSITTEVSDTPFTEEMLEQIKAISERTYVMNNITAPADKYATAAFGYMDDNYGMGPKTWHWGSYATTTTNNSKKYWIYYICTTDPEVDMKTVGIKENMKLTFSSPEDKLALIKVDAVDKEGKSTVEVIKAENNMSWITVYCYKGEDLYIGYMVLPWN